MATKDIGKGWGDLNAKLSEWYCPKCAKSYPVSDWSVVIGPIGDGRKCPSCDFQAFQHGETMRMVPIEHRPMRDVASEIKIPPKRAKK